MRMDRRAFLGGAFGLVVVAAGASIAATSYRKASQAYHTTSGDVLPDAMVGPAMMPGISLVRCGGSVRGMAEDVHLFDVDTMGAELIERADGTSTLDELAEMSSIPVKVADVATFFVTLGQAGYLQNKIFVNLTQTIA